MKMHSFTILPVVFCVFVGVLRGEETGKKEVAKAPVEAILLAKDTPYILPVDQHGEAFRKRIRTETDSEKLPASPTVHLVLQLKNRSRKDVFIHRDGVLTSPQLEITGEGMVYPDSLTEFSGGVSISGGGHVIIRPGKTHSIHIKTLQPETDTPTEFWSEPGEYEITATFTVHTGLPPSPTVFAPEKPAKKKYKPKSYTIKSEPIKVSVVLEK